MELCCGVDARDDGKRTDEERGDSVALSEVGESPECATDMETGESGTICSFLALSSLGLRSRLIDSVRTTDGSDGEGETLNDFRYGDGKLSPSGVCPDSTGVGEVGELTTLLPPVASSSASLKSPTNDFIVFSQSVDGWSRPGTPSPAVPAATTCFQSTPPKLILRRLPSRAEIRRTTSGGRVRGAGASVDRGDAASLGGTSLWRVEERLRPCTGGSGLAEFRGESVIEKTSCALDAADAFLEEDR